MLLLLARSIAPCVVVCIVSDEDAVVASQLSMHVQRSGVTGVSTCGATL